MPVAFPHTISFRSQLKQQTLPDHVRVEAAFDTLDIGRRDHLLIFLKSHALALEGVDQILAETLPFWSSEVRRLYTDLCEDIEALEPGWSTANAEKFAFKASSRQNFHPLGITYVVGGSRLGSQVLARRLEQSVLPDRYESKYLSRPLPSAQWRDFCCDLDTLPTDGDRAAILRTAIDFFSRFERALTLTR